MVTPKVNTIWLGGPIICRPKKKGDLGIHDLKKLNISLLHKVARAFMTWQVFETPMIEQH